MYCKREGGLTQIAIPLSLSERLVGQLEEAPAVEWTQFQDLGSDLSFSLAKASFQAGSVNWYQPCLGRITTDLFIGSLLQFIV